MKGHGALSMERGIQRGRLYLRLRAVIKEVFPGRVDIGRGCDTALNSFHLVVASEHVGMFPQNDVAIGHDVDFFTVANVTDVDDGMVDGVD